MRLHPGKPATLFTIGYEGLDIHAFLSLLAEHGVDTIVDVREMPLSRKPGFSKLALAAALKRSGCQYVPMRVLGCPKPIRQQYREDRDWARYTKAFLKYLKTQGDAIARLSSLATEANCALLCFEADANFCHRSMVANAVKDHCGAQITHIRPEAKTAGPMASPQMTFPLVLSGSFDG